VEEIITIKELSEKNLGFLQQISVLGPKLLEFMKQFQPEYKVPSQSWCFESLKKGIEQNKGTVYACLIDGKVAGYAACYPTKKSGEIYIEDLFVEENQRHKGIATKILKKIIEDFKDSKLIVETNVNNKPAIEFYKKSGFNKHRISLILKPAEELRR
jgi:ribosomal protein S18 acetylase RimI-like enzyme